MLEFHSGPSVSVLQKAKHAKTKIVESTKRHNNSSPGKIKASMDRNMSITKQEQRKIFIGQPVKKDFFRMSTSKKDCITS